jgi:hypothetical protein
LPVEAALITDRSATERQEGSGFPAAF